MSVHVCVCLSVCAHMAAVFHTQYINANCYNTVKVTDVKFDKHVPRDSQDMIPRKIFDKGAWPESREPPQLQIHLADICTV